MDDEAIKAALIFALIVMLVFTYVKYYYIHQDYSRSNIQCNNLSSDRLEAILMSTNTFGFWVNFFLVFGGVIRENINGSIYIDWDMF